MKANLDEIFTTLKPLLRHHAPPFKTLRDDESAYELTGTKEVMFFGKLRKGTYFAAIKKQKNFVGFYLMTIYAQPGLMQGLGPELKKCLKGKSCFHITKTDAVLLKQIKQALADGEKCYKKLGWI
ncbi:MAG TPA: DUF1801 domain-containing protein [Bacteroidota bacterium]|nr:DUF1801 domain-containing protein [Bacteroidota bacterium]